MPALNRYLPLLGRFGLGLLLYAVLWFPANYLFVSDFFNWAKYGQRVDWCVKYNMPKHQEESQSELTSLCGCFMTVLHGREHHWNDTIAGSTLFFYEPKLEGEALAAFLRKRDSICIGEEV